MEIRVALMPELAGVVSSAVCVVIDALRATTVIPTLFDRNCPRIYVAASHDTARTFARTRGYTLCGETEGYRVPDFDYGNSPVEFAALDFTAKPVVLSTTNGTKATARVADRPQGFSWRGDQSHGDGESGVGSGATSGFRHCAGLFRDSRSIHAGRRHRRRSLCGSDCGAGGPGGKRRVRPTPRLRRGVCGNRNRICCAA